MGNYRCRRPGFLAAWQMQAADMTFQGCSDDEIIKLLWPFYPEDHPNLDREAALKKHNASCRGKLNRLRKDKKFLEYYQSLITEWSVHSVGRALTKLSSQIDSDQPWLANKAANDVLTRGIKLVGLDDENTITVRVEGMPELGEPED